MKSIIALLTSLSLVAAQSKFPEPPATMDECGHTCITNVSLDPSLNCADRSPACLCKSMNFWYGIRDCSQQGCAEGVYKQVADWKDRVLCGPGANPPKTTMSKKATTIKTAMTTFAPSAKAPEPLVFEENGILVTMTLTRR